MTVLIKNIRQLIQVRETNVTVVKGRDMKHLPILEDAYLLIEHDTIVEYGSMADCYDMDADMVIDASGKLVLPTWCDSHTHLVYAGDRTQEFIDRLNGLSYEEIANRGGGILNSAKQLQAVSEDELYEVSAKRLTEVIQMGTGAIEIKSGYGLTEDAELKMLRVIKRLKKDFPVKVKPTLLAAHAIPEEFKNDKDAYVDLVINEIIPAAAKKTLPNTLMYSVK